MYQPERSDVEALRDNLLGDLLTEADPLIRYHALTREQALYDALVSEIKRLRGRCLSELREQHTETEIADAALLGTRQRVQKLIAAGRQ
jgi:hypothetical protein